MAARKRPGLWLGLVVGLGAIAVATWVWEERVFRARPPAAAGDSWESVQERYPMPEKTLSAPELSEGVLEALVLANPFSSQRRTRPPTPGEEGGETPAGPVAVPAPKFIYKGRIQLGSRVRAVVQNVVTRKTHFLEVGQEVAGFKLLDIGEERVVLSDTQTDEEVVVTLTSKARP